MKRIDLTRFFWIALVLSVAGLSIATYFSARPLIVFGFGIVPLVAYHLRLLAEVRKGLSQTSIDSVYYFGFLVTIATLATTVLIIAGRGGIARDISYIVNQFGLGLVATGYALFARIHLMGVAERLAISTPEQLIDVYIQRVKQVVDQVELSALGFENLANNLIKRTQHSAHASLVASERAMQSSTEVFTDTVARFENVANTLIKGTEDTAIATRNASERAMQSVTSVFTETITKAVAAAKSSLDAIAASLGEIKLSSDVQELKAHIASMGAALGGISTRLKTFEKAISAIESDFSEASTAAGTLSTNVQGVAGHVEQISQLSNSLVRLRESFELVAQRADGMQKGVAVLNAGFARLVSDTDKSLLQISTSLEKSSRLSAESVDRLAGHLATLVDFIISESKKKQVA